MTKVQKWIFENFQSPGDVVMLTAAVRDLHRGYPRQFLTDVRTSCPELWENNPYLTPLKKSDPEVEVLECHYPLIHQSNHAPFHFLHGFIEYLNDHLGLRIRPTLFKGDIHLSQAEKALPSQVHEIVGADVPYWIVVAGGKYDFTIKWWHFRRYQAVVDHFQGKILFVQVGEKGGYHPPLDGVIDLRGKTTLREVQDKLATALRAQRDGVLLAKTDQTLSAYLEQWLETMAKPSVRPRTFENYRLNVRRARELLLLAVRRRSMPDQATAIRRRAGWRRARWARTSNGKQ